MRTRLLRLLLPALASLTACGSGPDPGDDVAIDAGPPTLVGNWRAVPHTFQPTVPDADVRRLEFGADGTLTVRAGQAATVYDYVDNGDGTVTATNRAGGNPHVQTFPIHLTEDRLVDEPLLRSGGGGEGGVGTWTNTLLYDGVNIVNSWQLEEDGFARFNFARGTDIQRYEGEWQQNGDDVWVAVVVDEFVIVDVFFTLFDGRLGEVYERAP